MGSLKKASLVISCYNGEANINNTLASIYNQDYGNAEIVVVDDASTDATPRILEMWKSKFSERGYRMIVARHAVNKGLCAGINTGLDLCTGEYLAFPDSDDYLYPDYISSFVEALEANPEYGWARCNAELFNERSGSVSPYGVPSVSMYKNDFYDFVASRMPHNAFMLMARRTYFERHIGRKIYDSRLTQEWSLNFPLSIHGAYLRVPKTLYRYILRKNSMSHWIYGELESVLQHESGLAELKSAVVSSLRLNNRDKINVHLALDLVHAFRVYVATSKRGAETSAIEEKLNSLIESITVSSDVRFSFPVRVEHALDSLLEAAPAPLLETLHEQQKLLSRGYIVYGAGSVFKRLIDALIAAFGPPAAIWDQSSQGSFQGIPVTTPDLSSEKLPVVITVSKSKYVSEIKA